MKSAAPPTRRDRPHATRLNRLRCATHRNARACEASSRRNRHHRVRRDPSGAMVRSVAQGGASRGPCRFAARGPARSPAPPNQGSTLIRLAALISCAGPPNQDDASCCFNLDALAP